MKVLNINLDKTNKEDEETLYHWSKHHKYYIDAFLIIAAGLVIFLSFRTEFVRNNIIKSLKYIKNQGYVGIGIFMIGSILISIVTSNCTLPNIASGIVYGFNKGSIISIVIVYIISVIAYYIGQKVWRKKIINEINTNTKLDIFKKIKDNESKLSPYEKTELIFLSRLPPIYPFQYISYFWGILDVKIIYYLIGTLGILPSILLESYMGSLLENIEELFVNTTKSKLSHIKIMVVTVIISTLISVFIGYLGKKMIYDKVYNLPKEKHNDNL
jgi:uncharacterized membrane protein YdjX (TVP38/TMEM64 family)